MYFIGDTHGIRPVFELIDKHGIRDSNLIHVGDFGLGFQEITRDVKNLLLLDEALIDTNNHLYVIRGNHDNPIFWEKVTGLYLPKFHNLHLMDDFDMLTIEGKNVLFAGGAISIDRIPRKIDNPPTWWNGEFFLYQKKLLTEQLKKFGNKVDIVVTHTAPNFCHPTNDNVEIVNYYHSLEAEHGNDLKDELKEERADMTEFYDDLTIHHGCRPTHWFYGHFHASKRKVVDGTAFKLLSINEVYEVNEFGEGTL